MKRLFLATILATSSLAAMANGPLSAYQAGGGLPGANGGGGGGGGGGFAAAIAAAAARAQAQANAVASNQIGIANGLTLTTGATTATGGLGGMASALGGSIGSGAVTVNAGTEYKAAAAPSIAPPGHGPVKGCRLFVGLSGASTSGSGGAGIPIGNDQYCVTDNSHELMDRMNARIPGTFTDDDYLRPICLAEGMSKTAACKAFVQRETAGAPPQMAYTPN